MSKHTISFSCPNCNSPLRIELILQDAKVQMMDAFATHCSSCYHPLIYYPKQNRAEIRIEKPSKKAFLIHSSKREDKAELDWLRTLLKLYGILTIVIEDDKRAKVDWLQKSLDGIRKTDFVIAFLTKRYQFTNEQHKYVWKAPDKCYDEITMSFTMDRTIFALVENETDPGRVLEDRAWFYLFSKQPTTAGAPITADIEFFDSLDRYVNHQYVPL
jgi:hypothetical protein